MHPSGNSPMPKASNYFGLLPEHRPFTPIYSDKFLWEENRDVEKVIMNYYNHIPDVKTGLFLSGPAGTGKTTIAVSIGQRWLVETPPRDRYVHAYDWFDLCDSIKTLPEYRSQKQQALLFNLTYLPSYGKPHGLMIIDDFASGRMTENVLSETEKIIRNLEKQGSIVIFTTNAKPDKIIELYNDQVWSRICSMTFHVELSGKDHRVE